MIFGMKFSQMRVAYSVGLVLILTACVTTERGGIGSKADKAQALELTLQLARQYVRDRNWEPAKRHLKTALEMDKTSPEIYEVMALVFQNTGEIQLAEQNYKKSIKLDSSYSRVRNNYGAFLYQQRRFKEAAEQLERVVADTLYENRGPAFENLGRCYIQLKELKKAEEVFRRAYLMNRNNFRVTYALADVYFQLDEYATSQRYFDAYRRLSTRQSAEALWLGIRLADKFGNRDALSSFVLALKNLYPTSQQYLDYKSAFGNEHP
jgi:type IV pilus assembly protein PilF